MLKGTMRWTSTTKRFGLLTPDDGSREIFVRLSSGTASQRVSNDDGEGPPIKDVVAPTRPQWEGTESHHVASRVEVRTRYVEENWSPGWEIARVVDSGYYVRRPGSRDMLPEMFVPADVRQARD
jgi:cold shock CspA family protein